MSFLNELKKQKNKLKETCTIVTRADGQRYIEKGCDVQNLQQKSYGFVVDTKPDDIPVEITDYLYIGSQDCAVDSVLGKYCIRNVLSLGVKVESNAHIKHLDCLDLPDTDVSPVLQEALPFINDCIIKKENVLVHCNAGVSRTSMVAIAYLMKYKNMEFDDAYTIVKNKRPAAQPNLGFTNQLKLMRIRQVI